MLWRFNLLAIGVLGALLSAAAAAAGPDAPARQSASVAAASVDLMRAAGPTDKELIEKQKVCPVMDQPLGSMGKPVKLVVKGRTVFLCCKGCQKKLLADPDKYLKKLDQKK